MKKTWKKGKSQKEKVEELVKKLEEGVENFTYSPEHFKAILEMKALMPTYSFRNIMVAKAQLPNATYLAPLKRWNGLGRKVRKGSHAIRIFAPRFVKKQAEEEKEDCTKEEKKLAGFIAVPVFDVSQTEGDPLPIDKIRIKLEGDCPEAREIIRLAEEIAKRDDCPVKYGDTGMSNGWYEPARHRITVSEKLSINHRCKTLVHELVHSKVHQNPAHTTRKEQEIVAEGTAFVVCSYFGLDTSDYSFDYVKSWSQGDEEALLKFGEQICKISQHIITEFESLQEEKTKQVA